MKCQRAGFRSGRHLDLRFDGPHRRSHVPPFSSMNTLIVSDSPAASTQLRRALAAHGHECPLSQVVPLDAAASASSASRGPIDLLLIVLPRERERSLQIVRSLRPATAGRLVVMGPADEPKHILEILHAGADDYLDESADPVAQLSQELARSAANVAVQRQGGPLLTVTSASGGAGCTLLSSNLAVLLAQRSGTCGLLELVSGYGDLSDLLNLEPRHSLADLCRNIDALDQNMLKQSFSTHESGVQLIVAPQERDDAACITRPAVDRILQTMRQIQPWTVVDTDLNTLRRSGLPDASSLLIVVTRLDLSSLCRTKRLLGELADRGITPSRTMVVANRCGHPSEIPRGKVQAVLGQSVEIWLPDDVNVSIISVNCGNPAVRESPRSPLARQLCRLAELVSRRFPSAFENAPPQSDSAVPRLEKPGMMRRAAGFLF